MEIYKIKLDEVNPHQYKTESDFARDIAKYAIDKDGYAKRTLMNRSQRERAIHVIFFDGMIRVRIARSTDHIKGVRTLAVFLLTASDTLIEYQ